MSEIAEGRYYIRAASGRVLEASRTTFKTNGAAVQSGTLSRTLNQLWEISRVAPGEYRILNVGAGRVLDAHDADVDRNGCRIQLYDAFAMNRNQRWRLRDVGEGRYALRCAASLANKVLQAAAGAASLHDFEGSSEQVYTLMPALDAAIVRPNFVDLRANQTPIKDQARRGSCTYFGVTGALEAAYRKAGYGELNLSEEFWSMMAKALYIHPVWPDIRSTDYRENQFAGTQGGGSMAWYRDGFRIPLEGDVAYRTEDYVPSNWDSRVQKEANDFNFSLFTRAVLQAPRYYGARDTTVVPSTAAEFERLLDLGIEVSIQLSHRVYGGGHNVLLVGYDKTDAAAPVFFVKNSYGPLGGDPAVHCERRSYEAILADVWKAEYLAEPREPAAWPELAFLGRWNLTFDGHRGVLDLYHMPGIGIEPKPAEPDRRLGVFYDTEGRARRVNGSVRGNRIEFWMDSGTPNLPWHQQSGQCFQYVLEPGGELMTGTHRDSDGTRYGGYAAKGRPLVHGRPARGGFEGLANATWSMTVGGRQGTVRFSSLAGPVVTGVWTLRDGSSRNIEANRLDDDNVTAVWCEGSLTVATGRFLNHEPGLLCGSTNDGLAFCAAHVSSR